MTTFADRLKFLEAQQKIGLARAGAEDKRKGALGETLTAAGKNLSGPAGALVSGLGAGMGIRGAFDERKKPSAKETILADMELQLGQLRDMQVEAEKRAKQQKDLQKISLPSLQTLAKMQSGQVSQEEGTNLLTSNARAIYGDGTQVMVDPQTSLVTVFDSAGAPIAQTYPAELAGLTGLPSDQQDLLLNEFTQIATTRGQTAGQEKLAEARTVAEGVGGGIGDVRVGVGLDRPIERTQEIPFTGVADMNLVSQRTRGQITSPEQLAAVNAAAADPYLRKGGIQEQLRTEAQTAQSNLQLSTRALDVLERAKEKGLKITGTLGNLKQGARKFFKEAGLPVDDQVLEDFAVLESTALEQAIKDLANFKGPTTDFEFGKVEAANANTSRTVEENIELLNIVQGAAEKTALKPRFISDYIGRTNYGLVGDAEDRFAEFTNQVPSTIPMAQKEAELQKYLEDPNYIYTETIADGPLPVEQPAQQQVDYIFNQATGRLEKVGQ